MYGRELIEKLKRNAIVNDGSINFFLSNYILNNLEMVQKMTIDEFAEHANASKPSIVRFCKAASLDGFAELKYCIKNYVQSNYWSALKTDFVIDTQNDKPNLNGTNDEWYNKYKQQQDDASAMLFSLYKQASGTIVSELINSILHTRRIYIFAMNLAYNCSQNFVQRMQLMGFDTIAEKDILIIESYLANITNQDLIMIVSLSGYNPYLQQALQQKKCQTFGLLGQGGDLERICDHNFIIANDESEMMNIYSIKSQTFLEFFDYLCADIIKKK